MSIRDVLRTPSTWVRGWIIHSWRENGSAWEGGASRQELREAAGGFGRGHRGKGGEVTVPGGEGRQSVEPWECRVGLFAQIFMHSKTLANIPSFSRWSVCNCQSTFGFQEYWCPRYVKCTDVIYMYTHTRMSVCIYDAQMPCVFKAATMQSSGNTSRKQHRAAMSSDKVENDIDWDELINLCCQLESAWKHTSECAFEGVSRKV